MLSNREVEIGEQYVSHPPTSQRLTDHMTVACHSISAPSAVYPETHDTSATGYTTVQIQETGGRS